jgi:hypothetical protein
LELLSAEPWQVEVSVATGFPVQVGVAVNVPNPLSFALHKLAATLAQSKPALV